MRNLLVLFIAILTSMAMANITRGYVREGVSFDNGIEVEVEIGQTLAQLQTGLKNKENLQENTGMLFIFEAEDSHPFWMRNMSFPIDIIWINANLKIVDITSEALPCRDEPCPTYTPSAPVKYVLEVPAGFAQKNLIETGQNIIF
jgi:uncharacterized membrane protein (UPF0127 family)